MLGQVGEVNYKVQQQENADPHVVHVDKLIPYLPDFDVVLTPWIKLDQDPRVKATQTGDPLEVPGADTSEEERGNGSQPVTVHGLQVHQKGCESSRYQEEARNPTTVTDQSTRTVSCQYSGKGLADPQKSTEIVEGAEPEGRSSE